MIELADITAARERISPYIHTTPVLTSSSLDALSGRRLFLKAEHLQKTGSFKVRGALNASLQLPDAEGFITQSSGNHAQGIAYAAQVLAKRALIVMPQDSSPLKVAATKSYGAAVFQDGVSLSNREEILARKARETGYDIIHPFNNEQVMAGQGTQALELLEQAPELEAILVAVGGGGLISGISTAVKSLRPDIEVIGVEPETANDAQMSLEAGRRIALSEPPTTVADAVRTLVVGDKTFPHIQKYVDRIVTVPDELTIRMQELLMERTKQIVEPTAAMALAPVFMDYDLPRNVGVILCGGNWLPLSGK